MSLPFQVTRSERKALLADLLHFAQLAPLAEPVIVVHGDGQLHSYERRSLRTLSGVEFRGLTQDSLQRALDDGRTVCLNSVDLFLGSVARLTGRLTSRRSSCNAFLTAGGAPSSFGWHRDERDQIVLQLTGAKRWEFGAGGTPKELVLSVDSPALHVPLGTAHRVTAAGRALSVHLTIALDP